MNLKDLKELFKLVEKSGFSEVNFAQGDFSVNIKKYGSSVVEIPQVRTVAERMPEPVRASQIELPPAAEKGKVEEAQPKGVVITSPFVGTFYRAPAPDAKPFVDVGQKVSKGDALCIVEAMKLMNEIESEADGIVREIYAQNAKPVEFGAKLFLIEPV